ncbi:efflux RND transporter periplasmic adaptor subunit [Thermoproteota archaeon]
MNYKKSFLFITIVIILIAAAAFFIFRALQPSQNESSSKLINPSIGDITIAVSTTGIVEPQNRIEVKPSISGRIESILVQEGDIIQAGNIVAYMSSTERAALLDAAKAMSSSEYAKWKNVYKPVQIIAPISGEIIVRAIEPGQTINSTDTIVVVSDRLIVKAEVDETDVGKIVLGQRAKIILDAYPENTATGTVVHISYESNLVNNVTIYEVDIVPSEIPPFFRSGMSAAIEIIIAEKKKVVTIPLSVLHEKNGKTYVLLKNADNTTNMKSVTTGLKNGIKAEIISGLDLTDQIVSEHAEFGNNGSARKGNLFLPARTR